MPQPTQFESPRSAIAHRRDDGVLPHDLAEHLASSAEMAKRSAGVWGAGEAGKLAALWHDLGKYSPAFQKRIWGETEAHIRVVHAHAGACQAIKTFGPDEGRALAYVIAGHHGGLADWSGEDESLGCRLKSSPNLDDALAGSPPASLLDVGEASVAVPQEADASLWIRMLASAVFDADFLDTERYYDKGRHRDRQGWPSLADVDARFDPGLVKVLAEAKPSPVDGLRARVLDACRAKAASAPSRFSLSVPTGGGKTLSSLAFALDHARHNGLRRVIYAVPFTSIIEQTADVFRRVLGEDAVLEHHSALDVAEKGETNRSRLATETWDAPLIVTTTVQLFQSLFASRTSQLRKLHNLAGSVLVLDEAQALPVGVLRPVTAVLDQLVRHYKVSVVLCTATQPVLGAVFPDFAPVTEIAPEPAALFKELERVEVTVKSAPQSWEETAAAMAREPSALAIVNTRAHCRTLHGLLPPDAIHLSTWQCAAHRRTLLSRIKDRLDTGQSVRVVSTTLVEAGVDLDFPAVVRAMAGLDSLAQAAGRCNRNGRMEGKGRFTVFRPDERPMRGHWSQVSAAAEYVLRRHADAPFTPRAFADFFQQLYWIRGEDALDAYGVMALLRLPPVKGRRKGDRLDISFRSAAKAFQMIEDEGRQSLIVPYGEGGRAALTRLDQDGPSREALRDLQSYTVPIRPGDVPAGAIRDVHGYPVLADMERYRDDVGLVGGEP